MTEEQSTPYAQQVGLRLRKVRKQQRLSLQAVEAATGQRFKASVLGAYERGERAVSVPRLQGLAEFYNVPVDQFLPRSDIPEPNFAARNGDGRSAAPERPDPTAGNVTIDLTKLEEAPAPERELLGRYLRMIQVQRQDFNGRVLTIRADDLRAMACLIDTQPDLIRHRLEDLGLRR